MSEQTVKRCGGRRKDWKKKNKCLALTLHVWMVEVEMIPISSPWFFHTLQMLPQIYYIFNHNKGFKINILLPTELAGLSRCFYFLCVVVNL